MENSLKKHVLSEYASINEFEVFQQESSLVNTAEFLSHFRRTFLRQ